MKMKIDCQQPNQRTTHSHTHTQRRRGRRVTDCYESYPCPITLPTN